MNYLADSLELMGTENWCHHSSTKCLFWTRKLYGLSCESLFTYNTSKTETSTTSFCVKLFMMSFVLDRRLMEYIVLRKATWLRIFYFQFYVFHCRMVNCNKNILLNGNFICHCGKLRMNLSHLDMFNTRVCARGGFTPHTTHNVKNTDLA